jgi:acetoin:2,6-dichlorophenolindophenol oxidoreductase subunit alpha
LSIGDDGVDRTTALALHASMCLIRETETQLAQLFADGEIPGFIHLSIGQEAVAAGVVSNLRRDDTLASNHRGHGHALAKGVPLDSFFLEIMGRAEGMCKGRGGSMHIADMAAGMLGANGIVGAGLPIAVGSALAHQVLGADRVAVVFFGDGALAEGVLHESFNLASVWKLPVLFVCENNGWSEFSATADQVAAGPCTFAAAHKIPAVAVDGNDALAVHAAARSIVAAVRGGGGPRLIECKTTRVRGHFEGDPQKYRDAAEMAAFEAHDPILRLERSLPEAAVDFAGARQDAARRVIAAIEAARRGTMPTIAGALADVYSPARTGAAA